MREICERITSYLQIIITEVEKHKPVNAERQKPCTDQDQKQHIDPVLNNRDRVVPRTVADGQKDVHHHDHPTAGRVQKRRLVRISFLKCRGHQDGEQSRQYGNTDPVEDFSFLIVRFLHIIKIPLSGLLYAKIAQASKPERFFFTNGFIHILMVRTIIS